MWCSCSASEWLVGGVTRGGAGAELACAALGAALPALLRAAADMLLARARLPPAHYLYTLSQVAHLLYYFEKLLALDD